MNLPIFYPMKDTIFARDYIDEICSKYQHAVFDLDGTLLNTLEDLADSCNLTLKQLNLPQLTIDQVRQYVGNGIGRLMELAIPEGKNYKDFAGAVELMKSNYGKNWNNKTKPYDGIIELISALKAQGIKIGINSNKPDPQVKELASLYFSTILAG